MSRNGGANGTAGPDGGRGGSVPGAPRWAEIATHAVHLSVLPSALWRIALVAGLPVMAEYDPTWWEPYYIVALSVVSEGLALLTFGLIRPWGEAVPRWVPFVAGRRIPPLMVIVPAMVGGFMLTALVGYGGYDTIAVGLDFGSTLQNAVVVICYVPLFAWGPLLLAVTVAYWRRRRMGSGAPVPIEGSGGTDRGVYGGTTRVGTRAVHQQTRRQCEPGRIQSRTRSSGGSIPGGEP